MKNLKEMSIEELKEYEKKWTTHQERAMKIGRMLETFRNSYRNMSNKENADMISAIEDTLDSYEKEAEELDPESTFVKECRDIVSTLKFLVGVE